ncbi:MAG: hypothetical protein KDD33_01530 [Bdellovibrionales bacterium]|nr:hypothetical protein [Bdellovibrionales bacterium]
MADVLFILRMAIYTFFIVLFMQVKVGPSTLEQKVIDFTHRSQFSSVIQEIAEGVVTFLGTNYNKVYRQITSEFARQHSADQIPGKRLQSKWQKIQESLSFESKEAANAVKKAAPKVIGKGTEVINEATESD